MDIRYKQGRRQIIIWIPIDLKFKLRMYCAENETTMTKVTTDVLQEFLDKYEVSKM